MLKCATAAAVLAAAGALWLKKSRLRSLSGCKPADLNATEGRESKCPFGFSSDEAEPNIGARIRAKQERVTTLYEDYIHLGAVSHVWATPTTKNPQLEPVFAAAMHAVEIGMLMMATFVRDKRSYVTKRQRIDAVARSLEQQCILLADLVDAHDSSYPSHSLSQTFPFPNCPPTVRGDDGGGSQSACLAHLIAAVCVVYAGLSASERVALSNVVRNISGAFDAAFSCWSVGVGIEDQLNLLRNSVGLPHLPSLATRKSGLYLDYKRMVRSEVILATYESETYRHSEDFFFRSIHLATECWAFVALRSLNSASEHTLLGNLHEAAAHVRHAALVVEYMGANITILRCMNLRDYLLLKVEIEGTSGEGSSQVKELKPAARALLSPLLRAAKLADVAAANPADVWQDLPHEDNDAWSRDKCRECSEEGEAAVVRALLRVYMAPEVYSGMHDYAKALELLESAILGGFYYRHYSLAVNVIGSASRGTMNRSVKALKTAYETCLFPCLDEARMLLGNVMDQHPLLLPNKGRIMAEIEEKRRQCVDSVSPAVSSLIAGQEEVDGHPRAHGPLPASPPSMTLAEPMLSLSTLSLMSPQHTQSPSFLDPPSLHPNLNTSGPSLQPQLVGLLSPAASEGAASAAVSEGAASRADAPQNEDRCGSHARALSDLMRVRQELYTSKYTYNTEECIIIQPHSLVSTSIAGQRIVSEESEGARGEDRAPGWERQAPPHSPLLLMNHSFGQIPRKIHAEACAQQYALYQRGDLVWQEAFSQVLPQAASNIRGLLHLNQEEDGQHVEASVHSSNSLHAGKAVLHDQQQGQTYSCHVEFGHNTFDLVSKLMSARLVTEQVLRVLTSDAEFYSFNRQMKQLADVAKSLKLEVEVQTVPIEPAATFRERFVAAVRADETASKEVCKPSFNLAYVSQCAFVSQQTLLPDVSAWAHEMHTILPSCWLVVDGCHCFCAIDTDLSAAPATLFYVSTLMKHAACGANAAFMLVPHQQQYAVEIFKKSAVQPLWTGWMADLSVIAPMSKGLSLSNASPLSFECGSSLAGGTPAFLPALLVLNLTIKIWRQSNISVETVHSYTMTLHRRFFERLKGTNLTSIFKGTDAWQANSCMQTSSSSLTLSLATHSAQHALDLVAALRNLDIVVDCRGQYVRFGLGVCHSVDDIERLVDALEKISHVKDDQGEKPQNDCKSSRMNCGVKHSHQTSR